MGCRVHDERQLPWSAIPQGANQNVGKSGAAETRNENGCSIRNVGESLCGCAGSLIDRHRWYASFLNRSAGFIIPGRGSGVEVNLKGGQPVLSSI